MNNGFNIISKDARNFIYFQLDGITISRCKRVCKLFYNDISQFPFWKEVFARENPGFIPERKPQEGWEIFYKQQTLMNSNLNHHIDNNCRLIKHSDLHHTFILEKNIYGIHSIKYLKDEILCYNLITGDLKKIKTIPKSAFPSMLDNDIPFFEICHFEQIDEQHFLVFCEKNQLSIWNSRDNICIFALNNIMNRIFYTNNSHVICFTTDGFLEIWNYKTKTLIKQFKEIKTNEISDLFEIQKKSLCFRDDVKCELVDDIFFICIGGAFLLAIDLEKGNLKYQHTFISWIHSEHERIYSLKATKNHLIITTFENKNFILQPKTGEVIWKLFLKRKTPNIKFDVGLNMLIIADKDNKQILKCENLESGVVEYIFDFKCNILSWKIFDERIYTLTEDYTCSIIDLKKRRSIFGEKLQPEVGCNLQIDEYNLKIYRFQNHIIILGLDQVLFWDIEKKHPIQFLWSSNNTIEFDGRILVIEHHTKSNTDKRFYIKDLSILPSVNVYKRIIKTVKSLFIKEFQ